MKGKRSQGALYAGGKSAVVTYFFSITCAMGTTKQTLQGRDMLFLVKEGPEVACCRRPVPAGTPTGRTRLIINRVAIPAGLKLLKDA